MLVRFLNFLFPQTCLFCHTKNTSICENCFTSISQFPLYKNNIYSYYSFRDQRVSRLIKDLKYYHNGEVAKKFGKVIAKNIIQLLKSPPGPLFEKEGEIVLIPIPLNKNDLRLHNHAELIANAVSENLENSRVLNILGKNSKKQQNKTSSKQERLQNIKGTFSVKNSRHFVPVQNTTYILIDDVSTSGATINEARIVLKSELFINALAFTIAY